VTASRPGDFGRAQSCGAAADDEDRVNGHPRL
jgi:hypothetical protein